jgi:hypothetical protein
VGRNFTVLARDPALRNLGPIDAYATLQAVPRFNDVGSWSLAYPQGSRGAELLTAGGGVRIFRRDATAGPPVISGPVTSITQTLDGQNKTPLLTFSGPCDNVWLAARRAYPVPGQPESAQTSAAFDVRTGHAESVMKAYVSANAGPAAHGVRPVAGLVVAADLAAGLTVTGSARFDVLLTLLQGLAVSGGGLGFNVQQIGRQLVFNVYQPADLTKRIRFSTATGSLGGYQYQLTGPSGTTAIVGDGGSGAGRAFSVFTDTQAESDWAMRFETFVDQSGTTDATQIAQAGQQALDSGSPQAQVTFSPVDTPQRRYGIDYGLGDTVTVVMDTVAIADVVREVTIADDPQNGLSWSPTVGTSQASDPSSASTIYRALRSVAIAIGKLQRER